MHTLSSEFTLLRVVNGEAVSAHSLGVTNGFVKPKLGERQPPLLNLLWDADDNLQGDSFTAAPFKWQKLQKGKGVYVAGGAVSETFSIIYNVSLVIMTSMFGSSFVVFLFSFLVPRPVIHPLSSPSNMFCVTSLDPDTLPSVATLLMDVMFYSGGWDFLVLLRVSRALGWDRCSEWSASRSRGPVFLPEWLQTGCPSGWTCRHRNVANS